MDLSGKNILMIIAPENFRDEELLEPKEILENYGASVVIASKNVNSANGSNGAIVSVDIDIKEANFENYDAIVFVGGSGSLVYFEDEIAHKLAKDAYKDGKIVAAICIAPSTLANAELLKGKTVTSFPSEQKNLEYHGANYTGKMVEVDERIITGNGPSAATEFGEKIAEALSQ